MLVGLALTMLQRCPNEAWSNPIIRERAAGVEVIRLAGLRSLFRLVIFYDRPGRCFAPSNACAQVTILYSFGASSNDGVIPLGGFVQAADGTLYGTTGAQLSNISNTAFPTGTVFKWLASTGLSYVKEFPTTGPHHLSPRSPLLQFSQALIGVISATNKANGLIYRLTDSGNFEVLHTFGKGQPIDDGTEPVAPVIAGPNGHLYGLTLAGGKYNSGAVYKLNPANQNKVTIVHSFNTEGPFAYCLILGKDGNFYGLASSITGDDIIFMMTPAGQVNTLYTFTFTGNPGTLMQASDGTFYGTTFSGDGLYGTVFKMTGKQPSVTVTIQHTFGQGEDGQNPVGPVAVGPNGNLYGETQSGGTGGDGTIYEISTDGTTYSVVHNFNDGSIPNDGSFPNGGLTLGADNNFYGATRSGGANNWGTLFKFSP